MINYFKTVDSAVVQLENPQSGCWINVVEPTETEISMLINDFGLDSGFVKSALDEEESSRIETEDNQTLVIVDSPVAEKHTENTILYSTVPIGIIITKSFVLTITTKENVVLSEMASGLIKNVQTGFQTQFILILLLRIAARFLQFLKQIDKITLAMEKHLYKSMRNKELIQLLELEKSLVYFSTSLKANEITLEKILRGRVIKLYDDDQDLLEDVLIEVKQAIEMSGIYTGILSGMMDAFASVISNNLNVVMKRLTIITIVLAIPTIIFSFYGMNVPDLPFPKTGFTLIISAVVTSITAFILLKKDK
ncbi:MAG: magnesium transporter CorA family protein [Oscillospiraceae bacterium]|jgi:magnesium transporter